MGEIMFMILEKEPMGVWIVVLNIQISNYTLCPSACLMIYPNFEVEMESKQQFLNL